MIKRIYNYFFKTHTNNIISNLITSFFGEFMIISNVSNNETIAELNKAKSTCLSILYEDDDVNYDSLMDKIKYYAKIIYNGLIKLDNSVKEKNSIIEKLTNEMDLLNKNTYLNIDDNLFKTTTYKHLFIQEKIELESQNASEDVILNKFNNLINQETIYLKGILDAIDYAKNKKSKAKSIYSQLEETFLIKNEKE